MSDPKPSGRLRWDGAVLDPFLPPGEQPAPAEDRPEHADAEAGRLLDHFLARMSALGATREEGLAVAQGWYDLTDDWTEDRRREVALGWTDDQIREDFLSARNETAGLRNAPVRNAPPAVDEADAGTDDTEGEQVADNIPDMARELVGAGATVQDVLDWVGDDAEKAAASLQAEGERADGARSTLVEKLERLASRG